jgi:hypothetical protein
LLGFRDSESLLLLAPGVPIHGTAFAATVVIGAIAIAAFVAARSPLDIAMLAWIGLVLTQVRQTFAWYPVAVVPWLVSVPRLGRPAMAPLVLQARVLVFLFLTLYIHVDDRSIVETVLGTWIFKVIRGG